jgi:hypothetical protein
LPKDTEKIFRRFEPSPSVRGITIKRTTNKAIRRIGTRTKTRRRTRTRRRKRTTKTIRTTERIKTTA